jgi:hypothetical protein
MVRLSIYQCGMAMLRRLGLGTAITFIVALTITPTRGATPSDSFSTVNSVDALLNERPQYIAKILCDMTGGSGAEWQLCGLVAGSAQSEDASPTTATGIFYYGPVDTTPPASTTVPLAQDKSIYAALTESLLRWQKDDPNYRTANVVELNGPDAHSPDFSAVLRSSESQDLHPFLNVPARVSDFGLRLSYGVDLFSVEGKVVRIPDGIFSPLHYMVPTTLAEYDGTEGSNELEPKCNGSSKFAILMHEPHAQRPEEARLFFFLKFLQDAYPDIFSQLVVFQEGQPSAATVGSLGAPADPSDSNTIDQMVKASQDAWMADDYAPLNGNNDIEKSPRNLEVLKEFAAKYYTPEATDKIIKGTTLSNLLIFYSEVNQDGSLNTFKATRERIERLPPSDDSKQLLDRIRSLRPYDAGLAKFLIGSIGYRGALGYELYTEGDGSASMSVSSSKKSVSVFGLEKPEIYLASCLLNESCAPTLVDSTYTDTLGLSDIDEIGWKAEYQDVHDRWKKIQPYRDWLMEKVAVRKLQELPPRTIPIILASVGTHLPLVREFFCRDGYNTATLGSQYSVSIDPKTDRPSKENALDWFLTTLIMQFLNDIRFDAGSIPQPSESIGNGAVRLQEILGGFQSIQ